jgi:hypothetical protein
MSIGTGPFTKKNKRGGVSIVFLRKARNSVAILTPVGVSIVFQRKARNSVAIFTPVGVRTCLAWSTRPCPHHSPVSWKSVLSRVYGEHCI